MVYNKLKASDDRRHNSSLGVETVVTALGLAADNAVQVVVSWSGMAMLVFALGFVTIGLVICLA